MFCTKEPRHAFERDPRGVRSVFSNGNRRGGMCCTFLAYVGTQGALGLSNRFSLPVSRLTNPFRIGRIYRRVAVKEERSASESFLCMPHACRAIHQSRYRVDRECVSSLKYFKRVARRHGIIDSSSTLDDFLANILHGIESVSMMRLEMAECSMSRDIIDS